MNAVLVDLYDTLVWTDWEGLSERLMSRLGIDLPVLLGAFEATSDARGTGRYGSIAGDFGAIVTACGVTATAQTIAELTAETITYLRRNVHLYDDVRPVLRRLRRDGTRVALVSNCDHATRPIVDSLGLPDEVDELLLSCEVRAAKPDAAIFVEALRRLGVKAEDSLFVDDQPRFLDGAAALGIVPVQIVRERGPAPVLGETPHRVITTLEALL